MEMYSLRVAELRHQVAELKAERKSYLSEKTTHSSHYKNVVENARRRALYSDVELLRMEIEDNMMDEKGSGDVNVALAAASIDMHQNKTPSFSPATPNTPLLPSTITRRTFSDAERGAVPVIITGSANAVTDVNNSEKDLLLEALTVIGNHPIHSHPIPSPFSSHILSHMLFKSYHCFRQRFDLGTCPTISSPPSHSHPCLAGHCLAGRDISIRLCVLLWRDKVHWRML